MIIRPEQVKTVFLESTYLNALVNTHENHHPAALDYLRFFNEHPMKLVTSTICVAEFAAVHEIADLLKHIRIQPFDLRVPRIVGDFQKVLWKAHKPKGSEARSCVKDDIKILAHAHVLNVDLLMTGDQGMATMLSTLKHQFSAPMAIANYTKTSYDHCFGVLPGLLPAPQKHD